MSARIAIVPTGRRRQRCATRHLSALFVCAQIAAALCGRPSPAFAQTLVGEKVEGAFVTMTKGAKCPSTMTVAFLSQGAATGALDGLHDQQGSFRLTFDEAAGAIAVAAFTSTFAINKTVSGEMVWEVGARQPLHLSCDPLSLRIEGKIRYRVTQPFVEVGTATIEILGTRQVITEPYFGHSLTTFAAPQE